MKYFGKMDIVRDVKNQYEKYFIGGTDESKFVFIQKYLRMIEEYNESMHNIFFDTDPLLVAEGSEEDLEVDKSCLDFLLEMARVSQHKLFSDSPCAMAHAYLGIAYEIGAFGVNQDIRRAVNLYSAATRQNNAQGTFRLAQCFEKGVGKQKNIPKAITFYRVAAKLGGIEALHTYGSILIHGDLKVKRDVGAGLFYLKLATKAANKNYPYPYYDLARYYEYIDDVTVKALEEGYAYTLYEKGAKLGEPNCQYRLAKALEYGELTCNVDFEEAIKWYTSAAELGQIDAMFTLCQYKSSGVDNYIEKDPEEAYKYALKAAAKGHLEAAFTVGEFIENGVGTKQDLIHALWWYNIAKFLGHETAARKVEELRRVVNMNSNNGMSPTGCRMF